MTAFSFHRRSAFVAVLLLFSAVLAFAASNAWAGITRNITYNIVDYPVNEADYITTGQDTISGWITTDGTLGAWTGDPMSHILGGSLSWSGPKGSVTVPLTAAYLGGTYLEGGTEYSASSLYATNAQLMSYPGDGIYFLAQPNAPDPFISLYYSRDPAVTFDTYEGIAVRAQADSEMSFSAQTIALPRVPGSIAYNDPWVIATASVPEPPTVILLFSALLGLAAVCLRRRTARARRLPTNIGNHLVSVKRSLT